MKDRELSCMQNKYFLRYFYQKHITEQTYITRKHATLHTTYRDMDAHHLSHGHTFTYSCTVRATYGNFPEMEWDLATSWQFTHLALDHIKMWSGTIILDQQVFYKFCIMYQKKEKNFLQKMSPHLSQEIVAMVHRNYSGQNNLQILKMVTYTNIEDHYCTCKLGTIQIGKGCQMFICYFVYPKHQVLLICNENKEISVANLMIQQRFISSWE